MSSLNDIMTVARSGILSHQQNLNVIAHNITNVQTTGYHRQTASLSTNPANMPNMSTTIPYSQGTGVTVADIDREYNMLLENQLLDEQSEAARHDMLADRLPDLQSLLNAGGDSSVDDALNEYWTAWQDVASNPDNLSMRNVLLEKADRLASTLNSTYSSLSTYRNNLVSGTPPDVTGAVCSDVDSINAITAQVQKLNNKIAMYQGSSVSTADLQDQRDLLIRDLTKYADVSVGTDYSVSLDGQILVSSDGQTRNEMAITSSDPLSFSVGGTAVQVNDGILAGWSELINYTESIMNSLDTFSSELISQVNTLHTSGYDLNGDDGLAFFTGTSAADIAVNSELYDAADPMNNQPERIAAAKTLFDPGGPNEGPNTGDGAVALEIADMVSQDYAALNNQTFNSFYTQIETNLGAEIQSETDMAAASASIIGNLEDAIQSDSGVSLDEELVNMITAQRAYQACARLASETNSMFDSILNL